MAQGCYKTIEVKKHLSVTCAVLQTVNILLHWISAALATVQASLVFTPYLTHKKQQERDPSWTKAPHCSCLVARIVWILKNGFRRLLPRIYVTIINSQRHKKRILIVIHFNLSRSLFSVEIFW